MKRVRIVTTICLLTLVLTGCGGSSSKSSTPAVTGPQGTKPPSTDAQKEVAPAPLPPPPPPR